MKSIALVSSLYKPTTLTAKGGQEMWAATFLNGLPKKDYHIDLFALPNSVESQNITLYPLSEFNLQTLKESNKEFEENLPRIRTALYAKALPYIMKNKYDFIVDSTGEINFSLLAKDIRKPILTIGHFPVQDLYTDMFRYLSQADNLHFVFPSLYQKESGDWLKNVTVIPHGIDVEKFTFQELNTYEPSYWVGRAKNTDEKGLVESIALYKALRLPFVAYASFGNTSIYPEKIKPLLTKHISVIDTYEENIYNKFETPGYYKLLIYPLNWEEPFGLVMIEAMACGTPVIAFARGSVPEIVKDGETGFIVNPSNEDIRGDYVIKQTGPEGLREAVERIYRMSEGTYKKLRENCRKHVEKYFTTRKMINQYLQLFKEVKRK